MENFANIARHIDGSWKASGFMDTVTKTGSPVPGYKEDRTHAMAEAFMAEHDAKPTPMATAPVSARDFNAWASAPAFATLASRI